jgi:hypothetical protein
MIDPQDIVVHLRTFLPAVTDLFNNEIAGTMSISGNVATVTSNNHALSVGQNIIVQGGRFNNVLISGTANNDGTIRFETANDHDLTQQEGATILLSGVGGSWDGIHDLVMVPNRRTFEITIPDGAPAPIISPTSYLVESRSAGVGGVQTIVTSSTNTFTFNISSDVPPLPNGDVSNVKILTSVEVYAAASIERAEQSYTQFQADTGKPRLFVIMGNADVSKDRHSLNDTTGTLTAQNDAKLIIMQNWAVTVFIPTGENDMTGSKAQRLAYKDISEALTKVLYNFRYQDPQTAQPFITVPVGHGPGPYNTAYYEHTYEWQLPASLLFDSGFDMQPDVAFRDINAQWTINRQDMEQLSATIDLDEEPL